MSGIIPTAEEASRAYSRVQNRNPYGQPPARSELEATIKLISPLLSLIAEGRVVVEILPEFCYDCCGDKVSIFMKGTDDEWCEHCRRCRGTGFESEEIER